MTDCVEVQHILDIVGKEGDAIVPIDHWHEINSERETASHFKNDNMKRRLLAAKERQVGIPLGEALKPLSGLGWKFNNDCRTSER